MTISKKYLTYLLILTVVFSGVSFLTVSAQDKSITDKQTEQIRSNCVSMKNTLNQLHASDALLRVNRGQIYESILTKLIDRFNSRLSNNNINNDELKSITVKYSSMLDTFRADYKTYEEQLSSTLNISCSDKPADFYSAIVSARTKRNQVHTDVTKLNQFLDQYQSVFNQFKKEYKTASEGMKN
ncbi:MAG: hypothetical protein PWQ10_185 [Patescibacteria group bacterium]|nr:hypothetical protein [Patescibacteria group bacterium]